MPKDAHLHRFRSADDLLREITLHIYCDGSLRLGKSAAVGFALVECDKLLFVTASPYEEKRRIETVEQAALRAAIEFAAEQPPPTAVLSDSKSSFPKLGFPDGVPYEYEPGRWVCWIPKKKQLLGQRAAHDAATMLAIRLAE